jgi:hypothetical protein
MNVENTLNSVKEVLLENPANGSVRETIKKYVALYHDIIRGIEGRESEAQIPVELKDNGICAHCNLSAICVFLKRMNPVVSRCKRFKQRKLKKEEEHE